MVFAPNHMRDARLNVVDDGGEMEYGVLKVARDNEVAELGRVGFDVAADKVMEADDGAWISETDNLFSFGLIRRPLS
jgi:hypothetical protein